MTQEMTQEEMARLKEVIRGGGDAALQAVEELLLRDIWERNNFGAESLAAPAKPFVGLGKMLVEKMIAAEEEAERFMSKEETSAADGHGDAG